MQNVNYLDLIGNRVSVSENTKFLGLHINENLDWSVHISQLQKKLSSVCYGIRMVGKYMNEKTLKIMYYANFESILKYGIIFWGRDGNVQPTFVAQKRLVRIVGRLEVGQSCRTVFRRMGIMTVYALYIFECLMFLFRNRTLFVQLGDHSYNTRAEYLSYPMHRLQLSEKSPEYMCIKCYNRLPLQIKRITSQRLFKSEIKKMLINLEPYGMDDYFNM